MTKDESKDEKRTNYIPGMGMIPVLTAEDKSLEKYYEQIKAAQFGGCASCGSDERVIIYDKKETNNVSVQ